MSGQRSRFSIPALLTAGAILVAACAGSSASASVPAGSGAGTSAAAGASASASDGFDVAAATSYCTSKGGAVVNRIATWNTNGDPQAQLQLAGRLQLCEFDSAVKGPTGTRISVDLRTLYSEQPTIAAVAYLSKLPPLLPPTPSQNPAQYNCEQQLRGTASWGNTNTPGGWVDASQPVFVVMDLCVFPDESAIDEFGIFYYANGTVRGADLAPLLRWQPNGKMPAMFTRVRP